MNKENAIPLLTKIKQEKLLAHLDTLTTEQTEMLLSQVQTVDWQELQSPYEPPVISNEEVSLPLNTFLPLGESADSLAQIREKGKSLYRSGKVAAALVAGGQGTRLGHNGPKGCFLSGALSNAPLYQIHAEKVRAASKRYEAKVPFVIMTSDATDKETKAFFNEHHLFGLSSDQVTFFSQGMIPSLSLDGNALLSSPTTLLSNPDGHGGFIKAIYTSGLLQKLIEQGKEFLVYNQVDNMLALYDDPLMVGIAAEKKVDVLLKVIKKSKPEEKVGCLVNVKGRDVVVEYTDVTPEQTKLPAPDGEPIMRYGSTAMYCFSTAFLMKVCTSTFKLPVHRSLKPLKVWTPEGAKEEKGYKSERFLHDVLLYPEAITVMGYMIQRNEEFAPVKSKEGDDTVITARALTSAEHRRWLTSAGISISEDKTVEISPSFAGSCDELVETLKKSPEAYDRALGTQSIRIANR